jgi:hypothetical protein
MQTGEMRPSAFCQSVMLPVNTTIERGLALRALSILTGDDRIRIAGARTSNPHRKGVDLSISDMQHFIILEIPQ